MSCDFSMKINSQLANQLLQQQQHKTSIEFDVLSIAQTAVLPADPADDVPDDVLDAPQLQLRLEFPLTFSLRHSFSPTLFRPSLCRLQPISASAVNLIFPMDLSPKFVKPFDVFVRGRKRQRELDDDFSPLKCLSVNNSQSSSSQTSTSNNNTNNSNQLISSPSTSASKVRRRISLTPVKTGSPSHSNIVLRNENQENESASSSTMKHATKFKRQLNFGGIFSPSSPPSSHHPPIAASSPLVSSNPTLACASSDSKTPTSSRKERKKRKSTSDDLTSSKQKPITAIFKPISSSTPAPAATSRSQAAAKALEPVSKVIKPSSTTAAKLPVDWSLKTRIRITCKNCPVQLFRGSFKASEDASGVTSFTRCISNQTAPGGAGDPAAAATAVNALLLGSQTATGHTSCSQSSSSVAPGRLLDTSSAAILRQNSMVWCFPSIPYLQPLFPRFGAQVNTSSAAPSNGTLNQAAIECMEREFTQSFRSLTHLCKTRQCAFFYVCAATFTILFRAAGVGGTKDAIHALITPTTRGFRKLLTDEQIGFISPYEQTAASAANSCASASMTGEDSSVAKEIITLEGDCDEDDDDDPNTILIELGLSQQDFPSLQANATKNATKAGKNTSSGASDTSLIIVCGSDIQSLVNLICENQHKIASAKTGRLGGVPPTLLSPVAFIGSTLTPFKIKSSRIKGNMGQGTVDTIDIIGPILPSNVSALVQQFRSFCLPEDQEKAQNITTTVNLVTEENTSSFANVASMYSQPMTAAATDATTIGGSFGGGVFLLQSLSDSGIPEDLITDLCSLSNQARKPLKEVIFCPKQEYLSYT